MSYLWLKLLHILFMASWMAGIFYLPRIFVHYAEGQAAGEDVRRLAVMANKLVKFTTIIAVPTLVFGIALWAILGFGNQGGWIHAKLLVVWLLIVYHGSCFYFVHQINTRGELGRSGRFFRLYNEIPLLIFFVILYLVVFKPF